MDRHNVTTRSKPGFCAVRRNFCVPSKPALLIFACTIAVGVWYPSLQFKITNAISKSGYHAINFEEILHSLNILGTNFVFAILTLFYPLAGFIADIYGGRYRMIVLGLLLQWFSTFSLIIYTALNHPTLYVVQDVTALLSLILVTLGISCYYSNIIQFGFDQLLELPSCYLSMFVHWYVWSDSVGGLLPEVLNSINYCYSKLSTSTHLQLTLDIVSYLYMPIFTIVIVGAFISVRRNMFNTERVRLNPYKLIFKVVSFAYKHKYPIGYRSAFTYCYTRVPSRVDFAQKQFGGPFADSDVEDVKTFFRVLCILLALAPFFLLEVPLSDSVFTLLALHSGTAASHNNITCTAEWIVLGSGNLSRIFEVAFFPVYIWTVFSVFRNRTPRILVRLGFSALLCVFAVGSLLAVDLTGHILLQTENKTNIKCMFVQPLIPNDVDVPLETLNMHWAMLILPNLLTGIAPKLLVATALEFISAQSPHSMKGVMVGTLFAIRGLSQLLSAILVMSFFLGFWKQSQIVQYPPVISCGFGYFLVTILIASIGLVCFVFAAHKYKYRVRDEPEGFSYAVIEAIFDRILRFRQKYLQRRAPLLEESSSSDEESTSIRADFDSSAQHWNTQSSRNWYGSIQQNTIRQSKASTVYSFGHECV